MLHTSTSIPWQLKHQFLVQVETPATSRCSVPPQQIVVLRCTTLTVQSDQRLLDTLVVQAKWLLQQEHQFSTAL